MELNTFSDLGHISSKIHAMPKFYSELKKKAGLYLFIIPFENF